MFKTIDEVIARWKERYEDVSLDQNLLVGKGYSEAEIQSVEEHIGVPSIPVSSPYSGRSIWTR